MWIRAARPIVTEAQRRFGTIAALGIVQIFAWGSSYYLPAVLSQPIAADTGWPLPLVSGGISIALLGSGLLAPRIGRLIADRGGRDVLIGGLVMLAAGRVPSAELISHRLPLDEVEEAFRLARSGEATKVVVEP